MTKSGKYERKNHVNFNEQTKCSLLHGSIVLFLYLLLQSVIYGATFRHTNNIGLIYLICYVVLDILFIILYRKNLLINLKNFKKDFKENWKKLFLIWIICFILMTLINYLLIWLVGEMADNEKSFEETLFQFPLLMTIASAIFGPICEEFAFREGFKDSFNSRKVGLIISSILFAGMHVIASTSLINLVYIIPYLILTVSFAYPMYKTENVLLSMLIHILHNSISIAILFI